MTIEEIIKHWVTSAERDWKAVGDLAASGNNVHALFFAHLVIEKLLKAHLTKETKEPYPPRVHNLEYLVSQTSLNMTPEYVDELRIISAWNLEGRYQDYKDFIYKVSTDEYVREKLTIVNCIREWLLEELQ